MTGEETPGSKETCQRQQQQQQQQQQTEWATSNHRVTCIMDTLYV